MSNTNNVLVTGGAGYIGSHTVVELLASTEGSVVIFDNFCNSSAGVIDRIAELGGRAPLLVEGDIRSQADLNRAFEVAEIDAVIHFAGLKAVGESVDKPLLYYDNNVVGSVNLLTVMQQHACRRIVFSSSATVYGEPESVPITESAPLSALNPYGHTKLMIEEILRDQSQADPHWQVILLRYFNPIAAHSSGLIGEQPNGMPNNLLPYIAQVAAGQRDQLTVHGNDYDTLDGTGVRDYVHVVDLAQAHLAALDYLAPDVGCQAFNIGTGMGFSVLQMIEAFERISGQQIPYLVGPRRPGDIATSYADATLAKEQLSWQAKYGLEEMIADHWRWQKNNPNGFQD